MKTVTQGEVHIWAKAAASRIQKEYSGIAARPLRAYPIPRGGVPAAYAIARYMKLDIVDKASEADILIDDLIDSGRTMKKYQDEYDIPMYVLLDKRRPEEYGIEKDSWIVWPWEGDSNSSLEDNITRLLEFIGEDPSRDGLVETPARVAKAWRQWTSGYSQKPEDILKSFVDGAKGVDEMVILRDLPIYSHCEHHLAAIFGTCTIAYIPNGKIVGLSKLARLADLFARRLQVQERLTNQIADALDVQLNPVGVGVVIKARHLCMESRGICQQGHYTITSAVRGALKTKPEARAEFMELLR